jgi:sugar phosphate isomerase/epimerase
MKDYMIALKNQEKIGFEPRFAPVGDGTIDFAAFVEHAKAAGAKYFLVEQDNAALLPDTLGQVERSIRYITEKL